MANTSDVVILGGGVIGLTAAYYLARDGVRVTILDKGDFGQESSWAGAGILPPGDPRSAKTPFDQLRAHSAAMFPQLSAELKELTGIDNGYLRCGGLEFVGAYADAAAQEWRGEGVDTQTLSPAEVRQLEPNLADGLGGAIYLPAMAQVRNPWHLRALQEACARLGVILLPHQQVLEFTTRGQRAIGARTPRGEVAGNALVVTAGAWTDQLLKQFGMTLGIHPVRGQIMLVHPERPLLQRIVISGSQYLVPRRDGRILVGSTEEEVGFDKSTTVAGVHGLMHLAFKLVPALMEAPLEKCWAGLRPGSPRGVPFIGRVPGWENVFVAAGHFRAGIQLSPGTGVLLRDLILDRNSIVPAQSFQPSL
jgi:glycine oxidase